MIPTDHGAGALRQVLLALFLLGSLGTGGELLLVGHFEDPWQWLPLGLLGAGLALLGLYAAVRSRPVLGAFRALMVLLPPSALVGLILHYRANVEFALESHPDLRGGALLWEAVQGTAPPTLAPGVMVLLGLAGLGYAWRHPGTRRDEGDEERRRETKETKGTKGTKVGETVTKGYGP
jgi:hypothetical protein